MQPTDIAYLAGILDGEGCLYGRLTNTKRANGGNVDVRVAVDACSPAMIQRVATLYDGLGVSYTMELNRLRPLSTRPAQKICVNRKADVKRLLEAVLPYLVVKKPEAEIILQWLGEWGRDMRGANQWCGNAPTVVERTEFLERLRQAKRVA